MSVHLNPLALTEMLMGYLSNLPAEKKELFFDKIKGKNSTSLDSLISFIHDPKTYKHKTSQLSIGDTVYIDCENIWSNDTKKQKMQDGLIIDNLIRPALIVDIIFFPEEILTIKYHDEQNKEMTTDISNHYIKTLHFI